MIPIAPDGLHGFAFQTGTWRVRHRKLKRRLAGETAWWEFEGSCCAWEILDGAGNLDDHLIPDPNGAYRAATLRTLDRKTGTWSIYWADQRATELAPPLRGRFENGVGLFHGDDEFEGKPIRVRFIWSEMTPDHARWEQAFSPDAGATWEVNWVMSFERTAAAR